MQELEMWQRKYARERAARKQAEALLEDKSRELYARNEQLLALTQTLEQRVAERTRELEQAREAALNASRAKSMFLANMSHEVRTPLNGVTGMAQVLLAGELSSEQRECVDLIVSSSEMLLAQLHDVLEYARIDSGSCALIEIPFQVRDVLRATLAVHEARARDKYLAFTAQIAPELPDVLVGDPVRLRQVIEQLLSNAVKFTDRGSVALVAQVESSTETDVGLHVEVADTGAGISSAQQASIFEAFNHVDDPSAGLGGATGLGLVIASQLVRLMGGRLWVESSPGAGSRFHFTVKLPRFEQAPCAARARSVA